MLSPFGLIQGAPVGSGGGIDFGAGTYALGWLALRDRLTGGADREGVPLRPLSDTVLYTELSLVVLNWLRREVPFFGAGTTPGPKLASDDIRGGVGR